MRKIFTILFMLTILLSCDLFISNGVEYGKNNAINILNGKLVATNKFEKSDDFHQIIHTGASTNKYINYPKGYFINYPNNMHVDVDNSKIKTVLFDESTNIEIYYDRKNFNEYSNYSNKFLENKDYHILDGEGTVVINGYETKILKWHRNKLAKIAKDYNYYACAEIKKSNNEVYTLLFKSQNPINNFESIIYTIGFFDKKGTEKINRMCEVVPKKYNEETEKYYKDTFGENSKTSFGIFEPTAPTDMIHLNELQSKFDYKFTTLVKYQSMDSILSVEELERAYSDNKVVELTLQTLKANVNAPENKNITYDILNGKYDELFLDYARKLKSFGKPVIFRLDNEMNGDWCLYSAYHYSKDPKLFVEMWRYIYNVFKENGVDNVIWVWNPNDKSFPDFAWNHYMNYYPGDEYVDLIGLTGYNTGTYYPGEVWRDFNSIYTPIYNEYINLFKQPFMITEFGCNSVGGDKRFWIADMFNSMEKYPRIKIAIWWNGTDWDPNGNPARIYRLDTDEDLMNTFKKGFEKIKK